MQVDRQTQDWCVEHMGGGSPVLWGLGGALGGPHTHATPPSQPPTTVCPGEGVGAWAPLAGPPQGGGGAQGEGALFKVSGVGGLGGQAPQEFTPTSPSLPLLGAPPGQTPPISSSFSPRPSKQPIPKPFTPLSSSRQGGGGGLRP